MTLEIQVLTWGLHKTVAVLNRLFRSPMLLHRYTYDIRGESREGAPPPPLKLEKI